MLYIKDMSLSKKLVGGFTIVVLLLAIVGFVGYNGITTINAELGSILGSDVPTANAISDMQTAILTMSDSVNSYGLGQANGKDDYATAKKNYEKAKTTLTGMDLSAEEKQYVADIEKLELQLSDSGDKLIQEIDAAKLAKNSNVVAAMDKFDQDRTNLDKALEELQTLQSDSMKASEETAKATEKTAILLMVIISIVAAIIGLGVGLYIARLVTKPVDEVLSGAKEIANGNLQVKLLNKSRDEIGVLSNTFQTMANDLQAVIGDANNVLEALSQGDLTKDIKVEAKGDFEKITGGIKDMQKSLKKLIISMKGSADQVASAAEELTASSEEMRASTEQISNTAQDIAQGGNQQASKMQEISRAMKEMASTVQEVAINAQKAAAGADNANKTAQDVGKISNEMAQKMGEIQRTVENSSVVIKDLDSKSLKIGEIIGAITNIADQTNLLALNAAIEAARAGEHGRGFAVVADEVRKLAEESRTAANQITGLIKEIQQGTKNAVESMEQGTKTVGEGTKSIQETVSAINSIVKAAADVASMVQEIAAAAQEQSSSIEEVTSSVEDVSTISEQTAASTEEASSAAEEQAASMEQLVQAAQELAQLADSLKADVAKFNIGESSDAVKQHEMHEPKNDIKHKGPEKHEVKTASAVKHADNPSKHEKKPAVGHDAPQEHAIRHKVPEKHEQKPETRQGPPEEKETAAGSMFDDIVLK
ncbi:Sensory rhodopsin II transducer [uncultured archaeon]|nr:Sensory rhodopsin II transducer [uncultured archaeon]